MSWWQEPISAAKKIFPTASVLLVNVCVCVCCRREPGKTSWVLDQKVGDFVILYRKEIKRIIRKLKCIFFFWSRKWQFSPLAHSFVFWNNNRVRIGKNRGRGKLFQICPPPARISNWKRRRECWVASRHWDSSLPISLWLWCASVCEYVHRRVSVRERCVCELQDLATCPTKFSANQKSKRLISLVSKHHLS